MDIHDHDEEKANKAKKIGNDLAKLVIELTKAGMQCTRPGSDHLGVAISAATGTIGCVAMTIFKENDDKKLNIDDDKMLFAALLAASSLSLSAAMDAVVSINPLTFQEAMDMFEKLTGRRIEDKLTKGFLEFANAAKEEIKLAPEQQESLSRFLPATSVKH